MTSRSFSKSSKAALPSGTTVVTGATAFSGPSALRVFCWKEAGRWPRWRPTSFSTRFARPLCADPKEYRYCGYAEALAKGSAAAQERLRTILGLPETTCWEELLTEYRKHLFLRGALATNQHGPAFDLAKAQEVVEQEKGELSLQEQLRCKIRYFSDGVILGSRAFVESHRQRLKEKLGYKRKSGPTALKILGPAALWVFRNLRVRTFG